MSEYWKKYNKKLNKFAALMSAYNSKNEFNFIENNFYNHIRDLVALSISLIEINLRRESASSIKILDYGSNITTWSNIIRKINTDLIEITIFDPFFDPEVSLNDIGLSINIVNQEESLISEKFDLTIFGSCAQYNKNFFLDLKSKNSYLGKYVLFTHTPLSLGESFMSKQFSDYTGMQNVHSYQDVSEIFKELSYKLLFKSTLPPEGASVEKKYIKKTVYANLLFVKNDLL